MTSFASKNLDRSGIGRLIFPCDSCDFGVNGPPAVVYVTSRLLEPHAVENIEVPDLGGGGRSVFVCVLVKSSFDFVREMGCPDGSERAESTGSFNVADNTTHNQWRSLDIKFLFHDGKLYLDDCFNNFLLVHF